MDLGHAKRVLQFGRRLAKVTLGLSAPKGVDPVQMRGEMCRLCGGGPSTVIVARAHRVAGRRRLRRVCVDCREPWSGEEIIVRKGHVQSPRQASSSEIAHIDAADMWAAAEKMPRPDGEAWLLVDVLCHEPWHAAELMTKLRPGRFWSTEDVNRAVRRIRPLMSAELDRQRIENEGVGGSMEKRDWDEALATGRKVTVAEAQNELDVGYRKVCELIEKNQLQGERMGEPNWRIYWASIEAFKKRQRGGGG